MSRLHRLPADAPGIDDGSSAPQLAQLPCKSKSARDNEKPSGMAGGDGGG